MTPLDIITLSMLDLGVTSPGQSISDDDVADAFTRLNLYVGDILNTDRLYLFTIARYRKALTPGRQVYQIGPGATDWPDVPRPIGINSASVLIAGTTLTLGLKVVTQEAEWQAIEEKPATAQRTETLYYDGAYNLTGGFLAYANIYLHPIPSVANQLDLSIWVTLSEFTTLTQVVYLPPGYKQMLVKNLAIKIASSHGAVPSPTLIAEAQEATTAVRKLNAEFLRNIGGQGPAEVATALQQQAQQPQGPQATQ